MPLLSSQCFPCRPRTYLVFSVAPTRCLLSCLPSVVCALCLWLRAREHVESLLCHDTAIVMLAWLLGCATTLCVDACGGGDVLHVPWCRRQTALCGSVVVTLVLGRYRDPLYGFAWGCLVLLVSRFLPVWLLWHPPRKVPVRKKPSGRVRRFSIGPRTCVHVPVLPA